MSYVEQHLMPGERIIYQTRLSVWSISPSLAIGTMGLAVSLLFYWLQIGFEMIASPLLAIISLGFMLSGLIKYYSTEIVITDTRIIGKIGFYSRKTFDMMILKVESVQINQSILGRMLAYGDVTISAASTVDQVINFVILPFELSAAYHQARNLLAPTHESPVTQ